MKRRQHVGFDHAPAPRWWKKRRLEKNRNGPDPFFANEEDEEKEGSTRMHAQLSRKSQREPPDQHGH